jgi:hypothetical protein
MNSTGKYLSVLTAALMILAPLGTALAQYENTYSEKKFFLSLSGGADRQIGSDYERFDWGFNIAGNAVGYVNEFFGVGGRVAYNRWTADEDDILDQAIGDVEIEGDVWSMEILPIIRLSTGNTNALAVFLHGGGGLYVVDSEFEVNVADTDPITFGEEASARFGLQGGAGASLDFGTLRIEAYPLYNYVWTDSDNNLQYTTYNLGIGLVF